MKLATFILLLLCSTCFAQTRPATTPGIRTGVGADARVRPEVYVVGQAPATGFYDARQLGTWYDRYQWSFGDSGELLSDPRNGQPVNTATACEGAICAHRYTAAGTYRVQLTLTHVADPTGTRTIGIDRYGLLVRVDPDARRHVTVDLAAQLDALHLDRAGDLYVTLASDIGWFGKLGGSNVVVDLAGHTLSGTGTPNSVLLAVRGDGLTIQNGTLANASFATSIYGDGITLANIQFASTVGDAVKSTAADGLLMQRCTAGTLGGRMLFAQGNSSQVSLLGCSMRGSIGESPIRTTAGGIDGLTAELNDFAQDDNGKAVITLRSASNCFLAYNRITGGEVSFRSVDDNEVCRVLAKWNQLVSGKNEAFYRIAGNNTDICIRNTEVTCRNVAAVELSPSDGQAGPTTTDRITLFAVTRIAPSANRPVVRRQAATSQNTLGVVNETGSVQKIK